MGQLTAVIPCHQRDYKDILTSQYLELKKPIIRTVQWSTLSIFDVKFSLEIYVRVEYDLLWTYWMVFEPLA